MTGRQRSLVETVAQLLEHHEREAVLGDLAEAGESAWQGLLDVLGLVVRRESAVWRNWRPWVAGLGLALPGSFLLMGFSLSVSWTYQHFIANVSPENGQTPTSQLLLLICQIFLLIGCSWTGGFVMGSLSRRTLWVSVALCCSPCLFCLARFRVESLPRVCLLLFLLPAVWGVRQGLRETPVKLTSAIFLAVAVTLLMVVAWRSNGSWNLNWALLWPAWYTAATARRSGGEAARS